MKIIIIKLFFTAVIFSLAILSHANTISEVLQGTDNGFNFSGLHNATGCSSMCGSNFSSVSLDTSHTSFFHINDLSGDDNFKLYLKLDNFGGKLLTLSGVLDFTVAEGELIGDITADFADETIHGDTFFKFVKGTHNVGGNGVPKPNGYSGDLLSLWGANSTANHLPGSIGFDPNTADLGIDLVLRWVDVPEPGSVVLLAIGLFGLGLTRLKKRAVAMQ